MADRPEREQLDAQAEQLRARAAALPDAARRDYHAQLARELRDPDTYAVLAWLPLTGLHHFYLGRHRRGVADVALTILGVLLVVFGMPLIGVALILGVLLLESVYLFRSQQQVAAYNNERRRALLDEFDPRQTTPRRLLQR